MNRIDISPLFIGGLGNRLYQLAYVLTLADLGGYSMVVHPLTESLKHSMVKQLYGVLAKKEDMDENGGHPYDMRLQDAFCIDVGCEHDGNVIGHLETTMKSNELANIELTTNGVYYSIGYYFNYTYVRYVLDRGLFPSWQPSLSFPSVDGPIIHLRFGYAYDNFSPHIDFSDFAHRILPILERHSASKWTVLTNDASKIPDAIRPHIGAVYDGATTGVYAALHMGSRASMLIMSSSTLSAWMAYLGPSDRIVYCPREFVNQHGSAAIAPNWRMF